MKVGEDGGDREWDGLMASLTWWTWVWASSGSWWWTGKPGALQSMGSQRVAHDWATEPNWTEYSIVHVRDSATPWTIQSMELSRPKYWSGQPFLFPGDRPNPRIKPRSPALEADSLPAEPQGKPIYVCTHTHTHTHLLYAFICWWIWWILTLLLYLGFLENSTIKIVVHVSLQISTFIFFRCMLRNGIAGSLSLLLAPLSSASPFSIMIIVITSKGNIWLVSNPTFPQ